MVCLLYGSDPDPTCGEGGIRLEGAMHLDTFAILLGIGLLVVVALIVIPFLLYICKELADGR